MKITSITLFVVFVYFLVNPSGLHAQEESAEITQQGTRYIDLKLKSLDKYNSRIERQQKKMLKKLKRKEKHFEHELKNSDSLAYAQYKKQQSPSYDSISKMNASDTSADYAKIAKRKNKTIDSLKGVAMFVENKGSSVYGAPEGVQGSTGEMNSMQGKLNYRTYITQLITQHTNDLKNLAGNEAGSLGFTGIEKEVFYGKSKMNVFKQMEEDPTVAEDKAMELLQGSKGFDNSMNDAVNGGSGGGMGGGADASDLEKMGYQTKNQMQQNLQQKFGGNLGGMAKQVGGALSQWQQQGNSIKADFNDAKQSKQSLQQLRNTQKPSFKVNPMRGLPFRKRIEKQYNWQTTRTTSTQPALLTFSAMAGFKHTPKLTYGVGIGTSFGLGQSWQNMHLSWQGIGYKTYTTWLWQYGIGAYVGYERMYKQFVFTGKQQGIGSDALPSPHNNKHYTESILIGLTKTYKINSKYNGSIQVLYDIWWQQNGLQSPILLRFSTIKK